MKVEGSNIRNPGIWEIEFANDGIFPMHSYSGEPDKVWHSDGHGAFIYLQITLDRRYAIKSAFFQAR